MPPTNCCGTDFEDASASNQREAVASGERYVDKLNEELGKRAPMFVDDANFIRCACSASGMSACSHVGSWPLQCAQCLFLCTAHNAVLPACREVKEGVSQTLYPMDPDSELRNLMRTWTEFKRDFEVQATCVIGC